MDIVRCTAFMDVGTAVHPSYVEGQMQGGTVQGIGWALNEEYNYNDQGVMLNASFLDYRMPTSLDVPMIETVMVEVPNPRHPFGLRGVGEAPLISTPAGHRHRRFQRHRRPHQQAPYNPGGRAGGHSQQGRLTPKPLPT